MCDMCTPRLKKFEKWNRFMGNFVSVFRWGCRGRGWMTDTRSRERIVHLRWFSASFAEATPHIRMVTRFKFKSSKFQNEGP